MRLQKRKGTVDGYEWRCRNQSKDNRHDVVRSVRKGTWFSESKLAITIILRLTRYWFDKSMNEFVMNDLKVNKNMTKLIRHVAAILRSQVDVLGIKDPFEKKTRIELEQAAKDHFARHIKRDADGRYVVSLPWIRGHSFPSNCRNLAGRRLKNCVRSLERSKNLGKYEAVFHDWLNEDIIEEVQNDADKNEHYLPHHPVYKDNSTTKIRRVFDGSAKEKNSSSINKCL
ncbi:DUF1758 domain-containing protein [Trichonephila clavipes]|nr:DUF1758 domain-containing protein [Trichonephila clavipes]